MRNQRISTIVRERPLRFLAEANLTQIIRREQQHVDPEEARVQLNDRIREIFGGKVFETSVFPGGPFDVPDDVGDGRPRLVVLSYDGVTIGATVDGVPELIERIYTRKGAEGSALRMLRNNVVFVAADDARKGDMRNRMFRRLALQALKQPERLADLADPSAGQGAGSWRRGPEQELAIAVQQCYRHLFYPSRNRIEAAAVDLAHSAMDGYSASERPGEGQREIVRALRDLNKLRLAEDEPDSPAYVRDRTPLKNGQITTASATRRIPARPGAAHAVGRRHLHSRRAERRRARRVRLSPRRAAVRSRRSGGRRHHRRAGAGVHHGLCPQLPVSGPGKRSRRRNRHRAARDARAAHPRPAVPAKRSAKHRTGKNTAPIRSLRRAYCAKR